MVSYAYLPTIRASQGINTFWHFSTTTTFFCFYYTFNTTATTAAPRKGYGICFSLYDKVQYVNIACSMAAKLFNYLTTSLRGFVHLISVLTPSFPYHILLVLLGILLPMNRLQGARQCILTNPRGQGILLQ